MICKGLERTKKTLAVESFLGKVRGTQSAALPIKVSGKVPLQNLSCFRGKYSKNSVDIRRATRGRREGRPPLPFFENQTKCPDLGGEKALIVSIFGLNIPSKM